jgi:hypothetical protein
LILIPDAKIGGERRGPISGYYLMRALANERLADRPIDQTPFKTTLMAARLTT